MTIRSALSEVLPSDTLNAAVDSLGADAYQVSRTIIGELGRIVTPEGVEESFEVKLGGARQAVSVRGSDRANPLLLILHGGPGVSAVPTAWSYQRPWEDYFTVVHWDQRGAGRSFALEDPATITATMTLDRYRDDAIELIALLCERYSQNKVVVMGQSWGTAVGLAVSECRSDLLHAYVGVGQIINFRAAEAINLEATLAHARALKHVEAIGELESLGRYPGAGPFNPAKALLLRKWDSRFGTAAFNRDGLGFCMQSEILSPVYGIADLQVCREAAVFSMEAIADTLMELDFSSLKRLDVPVIIMHGRHDALCPLSLVENWFEVLDAPAKHLIRFTNSAHVPHIEQPGRFFQAIIDYVAPICG